MCASHGGGFSCCRARALGHVGLVVVAQGLKLPHGMWNLPGSGIEPMSPMLAGGVSTTGPPGKSFFVVFKKLFLVYLSSFFQLFLIYSFGIMKTKEVIYLGLV